MTTETGPGPASGTPDAYDLVTIALGSPGGKPAWSTESADLNVNLVSCGPGMCTERHMNREVDVLVVGISGEGSVEVDGVWRQVLPGHAMLIPKGVERSTRCDGASFAYLTCHRRRAALWPTVRGTEERRSE